MAYLLAFKMDGAWIMKYILLVLISIISAASFAKTGYENIITFNSSNWISQKTPTGFGLSCKLCDNQLMISMDIVPVNKSNKYTKSNADFISYLMSDKDDFARRMAADAAMGGKIKLIKADKAKINNKEVFRYMFTVDSGPNRTFDNTSMFLHKDRMIKITLNYYDGYFSTKDRAQVDAFYKSIKFTP